MWEPHVGFRFHAKAHKGGLRDTNNSCGYILYQDSLAQYAWVFVESVGPLRPAQYSNRARRTDGIIFRTKRPADRHLYTEVREVVSSNVLGDSDRGVCAVRNQARRLSMDVPITAENT